MLNDNSCVLNLKKICNEDYKLALWGKGQCSRFEVKHLDTLKVFSDLGCKWTATGRKSETKKQPSHYCPINLSADQIMLLLMY